LFELLEEYLELEFLDSLEFIDPIGVLRLKGETAGGFTLGAFEMGVTPTLFDKADQGLNTSDSVLHCELDELEITNTF
jgi:hypothetical protein